MTAATEATNSTANKHWIQSKNSNSSNNFNGSYNYNSSCTVQLYIRDTYLSIYKTTPKQKSVKKVKVKSINSKEKKQESLKIPSEIDKQKIAIFVKAPTFSCHKKKTYFGLDKLFISQKKKKKLSVHLNTYLYLTHTQKHYTCRYEYTHTHTQILTPIHRYTDTHNPRFSLINLHTMNFTKKTKRRRRIQ